jgi:PncC family amidohydrolase
MSGPVLAGDFPDAARLGARLRERGLRIAVAESCTGGLLGAALTAVPGSSDYVLGGVIAYANEVKESLLGVDAELLRTAGAVSEAVARAMAEGVRARLGADVGVGITGVAGPAEEGSGKPAGLVHVAVSGPGGETRALRLSDDRGREENRAAAVRSALRLAMDMLG